MHPTTASARIWISMAPRQMVTIHRVRGAKGSFLKGRTESRAIGSSFAAPFLSSCTAALSTFNASRLKERNLEPDVPASVDGVAVFAFLSRVTPAVTHEQRRDSVVILRPDGEIEIVVRSTHLPRVKVDCPPPNSQYSIPRRRGARESTRARRVGRSHPRVECRRTGRLDGLPR
jgi:hypothetical protein